MDPVIEKIRCVLDSMSKTVEQQLKEVHETFGTGGVRVFVFDKNGGSSFRHYSLDI